MATSPNYGWAEPDNSSLVKNGAQDIRALGDAIDTSLWNVGFGQAGKNKIINGDFGIWQRGTSFTTTNFNGFVADRYQVFSTGTGTSCTTSRQTFTAGTAPVAGYESEFFLRFAQGAAGSGNTSNYITQFIEDVRTFAGQTVTFSLWAKADAARIINPVYYQQFGSGGSSAVTATMGTATLTTSWARYTFTVTLPSIAGKTIGTGSNLAILVNLPSGVAQTIDTWGWQLEYGSKATPFQTATGNIQSELAACQRYLPKLTVTSDTFGMATSTTQSYYSFKLPVTARVAPTSTTVSALSDFKVFNGSLANGTPTAINFNAGGTDYVSIGVTTTAGSPTLAAAQACLFTLNNAGGYILFNGCEL